MRSAYANASFLAGDLGELANHPQSLAFSGECSGYPMEGDDPQELPILDNKFDIEQTRGDVTIKFSGEFTGSDSVTGFASTTMNCPEDVPWSASSGCCSRCDWCQ